MTAAGRYRLLGPDSVPADDEWIGRLRTPGPVRDQAVQHLHALMLRAARHRVSRMPDGAALGAVLDELETCRQILAAADSQD